MVQFWQQVLMSMDCVWVCVCLSDKEAEGKVTTVETNGEGRDDNFSPRISILLTHISKGGRILSFKVPKSIVSQSIKSAISNLYCIHESWSQPSCHPGYRKTEQAAAPRQFKGLLFHHAIQHVCQDDITGLVYTPVTLVELPALLSCPMSCAIVYIQKELAALSETKCSSSPHLMLKYLKG